MKRILIIILLAFLLMPMALAVEAEPSEDMDDITPEPPRITTSVTTEDIEDSQSEALDTDALEDALPEEAGETLDGLKVSESLNFESGAKKLFEGIKANIGGILTGGLKSASVILIIAIFCSTVGAAFEGGAKYAVLAGILAISAVSVFNINTFIGLGSKTLDDMNTFSKMLLPTLTAAAAASGAGNVGGGKVCCDDTFYGCPDDGFQKRCCPPYLCLHGYEHRRSRAGRRWAFRRVGAAEMAGQDDYDDHDAFVCRISVSDRRHIRGDGRRDGQGA